MSHAIIRVQRKVLAFTRFFFTKLCSPGRTGLVHVGVFILLMLSGERNFGVRLNKPYLTRPLQDIPIFSGNHADLLILVCILDCPGKEEDISRSLSSSIVFPNMVLKIIRSFAGLPPFDYFWSFETSTLVRLFINYHSKWWVWSMDAFAQPAFDVLFFSIHYVKYWAYYLRILLEDFPLIYSAY